MKTNSQNLLSSKLYLGDIDGDKADELITIDGRYMYVYKSASDLKPVLQQFFQHSITRLIIGDFVNSGREHGRDQVCVILSDGSLQSFAISDDLKSLWWWFTQPSFIAADEHYMVGDFDGNGADEILVYKPSTGALRIYAKSNGGVFNQLTNFTLGNLAGFNLINKQLLVGDFGQAIGQKDILVVDKSIGQIIRFDSAIEKGMITFWWAFTTNANLFTANDQLCIANITGGDRDGVIIRHLNTGLYSIFDAEFSNGMLRPAANVLVGQLPIHTNTGTILPAKVRNSNFRTEQGGQKRDDVLYFDEHTLEFTSTDARFDAAQSSFTYWWSYTSNILFEPTVIPTSLPWAVILCRFKGLPGVPAMEKLFREIFTTGSGGLVEYWHDASLGKVDIDGSKVLGWVELDVERKDAAKLGRVGLINAAVAAAQKAGIDPITGFYKQIAVFTHDWSIDNPTDGCGNRCFDWTTRCTKLEQDNKCATVWIDGSAEGLFGRVSAPPHGHNGTFLAHEMGHGFGFDHDLFPDLTTSYGDFNCIMSAMNCGSSNTGWNVPFGPSLSFPQLMIKDWMYQRRVLHVNKNWSSNAGKASMLLSPINDRTASGSLGAILPNDDANAWDYYLEYLAPTGWNKGIVAQKLVIRRILPGGSAVYLGEITVPISMLRPANEWTEPSGKTHFRVFKNQQDDRIIKVIATKI